MGILGEIWDVYWYDGRSGTWLAFVVSSLTEKLTRNKVNLVSISFNRNAFEIE